MKTLLKSLFVWLMLLAVPFQGFASATMMFCAPLDAALVSTAIAAAPHDHHAMLAAERAQHDHHGAVASHHDSQDSSPGHHADGKCNSCAACCFGAAMVPSHVSPIRVDPQFFAAIPFTGGFMPTVDPTLPERPPQASLT